MEERKKYWYWSEGDGGDVVVDDHGRSSILQGLN